MEDELVKRIEKAKCIGTGGNGLIYDLGDLSVLCRNLAI